MTAPTVDVEATGEDLIAAAELHAAALVCAVIDDDRQAVADALDRLGRQELYALAVLLAALIPDDQPIRRRLEERELLRELHAAYNRGDRSPEVKEGERTYQRLKKRRYAAARKDAA